MTRPSEAPTPTDPGSIAPPRPSEVAEVKRKMGDPNALLVSAGKRARVWSETAALVSIEVSRIKGGLVNFENGAEVRFTFARSRARDGETFRASKERLRIAYVNAEEQVQEVTETTPPMAAPDPDCVFNAAWRTAGFADGEANARYEMRATDGRALWTLELPATRTSRVIDGRSCAIVTR